MSAHRSVRSPLPALSACASLLVLLAAGSAAPAYAADEVVVDGVTYELVSAADPARGATAVAYDETANPGHPELVLPSAVEIDGAPVPVVEVGHDAFNAAGIESVALPGSVVEVGPYAFAYNPELASVDLADGVELIGTGAFRQGALTQIDLPDSVSRINPQAFFGNRLTDVAIPPRLDTLTLGVFQRNALTRVDVPAHVTMIRERAFAGNSLVYASLPETLAEMGEGVFTDNPGLKRDLDVHATRFVPLDQTGGAGPWGTIDAVDVPDEPTRAGHEFAYWHEYGAIWAPGDALFGDRTLSGGWIDLAWVQSILLTATPDEATAGEPVILTAEGFNANGDSLGEIIDEIAFDEPSDSRIVLDANRATFTEAGSYVITGQHTVTERRVSLAIEVRPASTTLPQDDDEDAVDSGDQDSSAARDETTDPDGEQSLAATGAEITLWTVGGLALLLGCGLLVASRKHLAKHAAR